jgi:ribosomal protein S12 methylthiotransferase
MNEIGVPTAQNILFIQLGCSKNRVDGEIMIASLQANGFSMVDTEEKADIIIINTCGFIEAAKKEAIDEILNAIQTGKKVVVAGCLAERYKDDILEQFPEVLGVIGVFDIDKIALLANNVIKNKKTTYFNSKELAPIDFNERVITTPFYYAFLKISDGCSNHCSYCAIPKIRGKYISRDINSLYEEAEILASNGATEIIVIAQDTTRYGLDLYKEKMLMPLLKKLESIPDIKWIRLHYMYPEAVDSALIDYIANSQKVLPYFDIPLQHINDRILNLMNRRTNKEQIISLLTEIKTKIPNAIIRTSLISGFPTETEKEHKELVSFVKKGYFDRLGVFPFSSEEGTKASKIVGKLTKKIKLARANEIMATQTKISLSKNKNKKGKVYTVLVEGVDTINDVYFGRTYMDSPEIDGTVYLKSENNIEIGDYVQVKITGFDTYDLTGEIVI